MKPRPTKENIKSAIIYARSNSIHSRGGTLEHQITHAKEAADLLGLGIEKIFSDSGRSDKPLERQPVKDMIEYLEKENKPLTIITNDSTRFAEKASESSQVLISLMHLSCDFYTLDDLAYGD
jgi:DNA invertase Pin-like site-specific DNA recombinase